MKNTDYYKLNLLPQQYKNIDCIWNMKRVPEYASDTPKYPRISLENQRFGSSYKMKCKYLKEKFKELVSFNLDIGISYMVL